MTSLEKYVQEHIEDYIKKEKQFCEKIISNNKSIKGTINYITKEVQKFQKNGQAFIHPDDICKMAIDYCLNDYKEDIKESKLVTFAKEQFNLLESKENDFNLESWVS